MSDQNQNTTEPTSMEEGFPKTKVRWKNKQSVLVFSSRRISLRDRLFIEDLRKILLHSKRENKRDEKSLETISEIAALKNCTKCIYFMSKKKNELNMWLSNVSTGPSVEFSVHNYHSMAELKLKGSNLIGSRPLLCFDSNFDHSPHWALLKELISQTFNVPAGHRKAQPLVENVFVFSLMDNKIWFRNFQIVEEGQHEEIGPRFVLNPIRIFEGSFGGVPLWSNPTYANRIQNKKQRETEQGLNKTAPEEQQITPATLGSTRFHGSPTSEPLETKSPKVTKETTMHFIQKNRKTEKRKRKGNK